MPCKRLSRLLWYSSSRASLRYSLAMSAGEKHGSLLAARCGHVEENGAQRQCEACQLPMRLQEFGRLTEPSSSNCSRVACAYAECDRSAVAVSSSRAPATAPPMAKVHLQHGLHNLFAPRTRKRKHTQAQAHARNARALQSSEFRPASNSV